MMVDVDDWACGTGVGMAVPVASREPTVRASGRRRLDLQRVSDAAVLAKYQEAGSVWQAGKALGICGQSVWERLRRLGVPLAHAVWTDDELEELRVLAATNPAGEIARRLGRTFAAVTMKMSRLGIRCARKSGRPIPRGAGYNKARIAKLLRELEMASEPLTRFLRQRGLSVDTFVLACQKHFPDRWLAYTRERGAVPSRMCTYCLAVFYPTNGKQRTCSRKCQYDQRIDLSYFGGRRRQTVGLAERICQLCGRQNPKGLSSHHVLGREHDPAGESLIALCRGCHNVVGLLARVPWADTEEGWTDLISLVCLRRQGAARSKAFAGLHVMVDMDWESPEDDCGPEEPLGAES